MIPRQCSIHGCVKPIHGNGLCHAHCRRMRIYGDPLAGKTPRGTALKFFENEVLSHKGNDCLIWPFGQQPNGYAQIWVDGRYVYTHRLVCERTHGLPPTQEHHAAHDCGKGHEGCVNPRHLRWATSKENEADKRAHGTIVRGERCYNARLTKPDVKAIYQMHGTCREIAARFNVSAKTVSNIKTGKAWRHVTSEVFGITGDELLKETEKAA